MLGKSRASIIQTLQNYGNDERLENWFGEPVDDDAAKAKDWLTSYISDRVQYVINVHCSTILPIGKQDLSLGPSYLF